MLESVAVVVLPLALPIAAFFLANRYGLFSWVSRAPQQFRRTLPWKDFGPTPLGEKGYTPQGLTWANDRLIFANSWKNTLSRVYEYQVGPDSLTLERFFDMPPEAVHTSGLAWDGAFLWAVDYKSNLAYKIDLEASLVSQQAVVLAQFDTGLKGTSACCLLEVDGETCLAISDFLRTRKTIVIRHHAAAQSGSATGHLIFAYHNESFSQGLEYVGGFLWESVNKRGGDIINQLDVQRLRSTGDARLSLIAQFNAPGPGVEDLAWDGSRMWTSDEVSFRFYCCTELPLTPPNG